MADDPAWRTRLLEVPTLIRVPAVSDLGVTIRVAGKVKAADRWAAPSELRQRLLAAFQANGIDIPVRGQVVAGRVGPTAAATSRRTGRRCRPARSTAAERSTVARPRRSGRVEWHPVVRQEVGT